MELKTCFLKNLLVSCIIFGGLTPMAEMHAQLNLKTGYNVSYATPEVYNEILDAFNTTNSDWLEQTFKNTHWLHGMEFGLRFNPIPEFAIELGWANQLSNSTAEGTLPSTSNTYYRKLNFSQNQFSFGIESITNGHWGVGATIDYNKVVIKSRHTAKGNKTKVVDENNWSSRFFITYHTVPSRGVSFAIRPYIQVPFTTVNFRGVSNDINETMDTQKLTDKYYHFGLSLLFFNG